MVCKWKREGLTMDDPLCSFKNYKICFCLSQMEKSIKLIFLEICEDNLSDSFSFVYTLKS